MTQHEWWEVYDRLCTALGHKTSSKEAGAYFETLEPFTAHVMEQASRAWRNNSSKWPKPGELASEARRFIAGHQAPGQKCQTCHGNLWVTVPDGRVETWGSFDAASPCPECRPGARVRHGDAA